MTAAATLPSRSEIIEAVEAAGSGDADFFGYPERADGLYLQQDPEEFGAFVHFMARHVPAADLSLDIGIASGGQTKFLRDFWTSRRTIVVDIGEHHLFPHWARIKQSLASELALEVIDDSHAPRVRDKLLPFAGQVDFAFVDGDHSYRGLRKDIFLTKELLKPGGLMALHDTQAAGHVNRVYQELLYSSDFVLVRNFANRLGISVWKLMRVKRPATAFNRATGWGKL